MGGFLKNYGSTLLLIGGVIVGGVCGMAFGEAAHVVKPVGELFLNLIFVLIVPLVFFSISAAVCKMSGTGRLGRLLLTIIGVFFVMTVIAALLAYLSTLLFDPLGDVNRSSMLSSASQSGDGVSGTCRHPPLAAQFYVGHIILGVKNRFAVGAA